MLYRGYDILLEIDDLYTIYDTEPNSDTQIGHETSQLAAEQFVDYIIGDGE